MKKCSITFKLTRYEKMLLEKVVIFEPFLQDNLDLLQKKGKDFYISFDASDLFDAISALKFALPETKSTSQKIQREKLIHKLAVYLSLIRESGKKLGI